MPKTLLLADDSITIQRVIELTFAHEDIQVVSVSDGRRAVQWMEAELPDVVLVDVEVPEINGYEVAAYVKQSPRLRAVPVLLLAGAFEPVDQDRVRTIGCEGVLVKPFEPQQLVGRVKELLARSGPAGLNLSGPPAMPIESAVQYPVAVENLGLPGGRGGHAVAGLEPEPLEPPERPVWEHTAATPIRPAEPIAPPPPQPRVSLVNAFSALLAAEQSSAAPAPAPAAVLSDASVEDAVRRVLSRMTDDLVRRIVVETAERLIKEEIEKIKSSSD